ncbi:MAG: formate dehydrogenase accessory protein FdhE, partial [Blastocatellia bacterium]|nr:formate dehydrogenase accessory protein FdhE [Blastocatellia bacterium]
MRIERAERLPSRNDATSELLLFYAKLLHAQKEIYDYLRSRRDWLPSGNLAEDLPVVRTMVPTLLRAVESSGPSVLVEEAQNLLQVSDSDLDQMLLEQWRQPSDLQFFAKAFLQPYARWLAESGAEPVDRDLPRKESSCPFCGGNPQLSMLQI